MAGPPMRPAILCCAVLLLAGCAGAPTQRESAVDLPQFETLAADARVRYEPGARRYAERVAQLLPAAIAQVEAAHYLPFAAPVTVNVCGTSACFARQVPDAPRLTAAVIFENRLLLAPRLYDREPERLYPILVHELSHLHLGQRLGHYTMGIPVWFHEGLASLAAQGGGADLVSEDDARHAIAAGKYFLPDAAHDGTVRKNADRWQLSLSLFYRESLLFLDHLKSLGAEDFRRLLLRLQDNTRFDDAFATAYDRGALDLARQFFGAIRCGRQECLDAAASP